MLRKGQWVPFLCLVCFGVDSSINHHQVSVAEMFTTAEDDEFSGKLLSKTLCLTLLWDFCLVRTFSITSLCHRKAKERVRKKINKRRQIKQAAVCSSGTYAARVCAWLQERRCWRSAAVQLVGERSELTGTPGKAMTKTWLLQGRQWGNTFPRTSHGETSLKLSPSGVMEGFCHPFHLTRGRGHINVRSSENGLAWLHANLDPQDANTALQIRSI